MNNSTHHSYGVGLLDDLHNYFPELLYNSHRFNTVQDLLSYIQTQAARLSPYDVGLQQYRRQANTQQNPRSNSLHSGITNASNASNASTATTRAPRRGIARTEVDNEIPALIPQNNIYDNAYYEFMIPSLVPPAPAPAQTQALPSTDAAILRAVMGLMSLGELEPVIVRASQQQLETQTTLSVAELADESNSCSICQEHYTEGQSLRCITSCTHKYHKLCIDRWFERNVRCPICRHDIRT